MVAMHSKQINGVNYSKNMKITNNKTRTLTNNRINNYIQCQILDPADKIYDRST